MCVPLLTNLIGQATSKGALPIYKVCLYIQVGPILKPMMPQESPPGNHHLCSVVKLKDGY